MRKLMFSVLVLSLVVGFTGCKAIGISTFGNDEDKDRQQAALEGAAIVALVAYEAMDHDVGSFTDHLRATLVVADQFIVELYPEYVSWSNLVELRVKDISNDRWQPQVASLYFLLFVILDNVQDNEEAKAVYLEIEASLG